MTRFPLHNLYSMGFRMHVQVLRMVVEMSSTLEMILPHVFFQIQTKPKVALLRLTSGKWNGESVHPTIFTKVTSQIICIIREKV